MVPACAGLTVAPIVMVLAARAAEMAMIVRLIEVPVMFPYPLLAAVFRGPCAIPFTKRAKRGKLPFPDQSTRGKTGDAPRFGLMCQLARGSSLAARDGKPGRSVQNAIAELITQQSQSGR
jgi:hypothetical protein